MIKELMSSLFGSGKTDIKTEPIITEADSVKDSNSETPIPQLSVEEEIEVLAAHCLRQNKFELARTKFGDFGPDHN